MPTSALSAVTPALPCADPSLPQPLGAEVHSADSGADSGADGSAQSGSGPFLHSGDLLQGRRAVAIAHNGSVYRLQATRLGKLILTK